LTTTGPRSREVAAPHLRGIESTPACPGYEVRMILEVVLDLRAGGEVDSAESSLLTSLPSPSPGVMLCSGTRSSGAIAGLGSPLVGGVACGFCLTPARLLTRPCIASTVDARWEWSSLSDFSDAKISWSRVLVSWLEDMSPAQMECVSWTDG
jgi:hypothetical protein